MMTFDVPSSLPTVAVIVPVYREPDIVPALARVLAENPAELIVVDGGDTLDTESLLAELSPLSRGSAIRVLRASKGRGVQMNVGAAESQAEILWFVHADTEIPVAALDLMRQALARGAVWGRFDARLSGAHPAFRIIEFFMNWRSALSGIVTGDQALFVRRDAFRHIGGYAQIPLMEDIDLARRLKRLGRPRRIRKPVITSSRRWEHRGIVRTLLLMWTLRLLFALGVSPTRLATWYR